MNVDCKYMVTPTLIHLVDMKLERLSAKLGVFNKDEALVEAFSEHCEISL